ncbi:MAG: hypothetical protein J6B77_01540 [Clostridia bacterium]|nr:hypothetical protein [Clostridia bacterium]
MTELEKIEYARTFMDKLANGINPLDDTPIPETDIVNNVRLSRCFFYVSDILRQVIENGGTAAPAPTPQKKERKKAFVLSEEERAGLRISERPITVSEIAERLNERIDPDKVKKISAVMINHWLVTEGYLEQVALANGKSRKMPTPSGEAIGIFAEEKTGQYGTYFNVLFRPQAQQFVYDHIAEIVELKSEKDDPLAEFHHRPWTEEHDAALTELFRKNASVSEMASLLKRTADGVRTRIKELGLN